MAEDETPPARRTPSKRQRPLRADRFLAEDDAFDAGEAPPPPPPPPPFPRFPEPRPPSDGDSSEVQVEFEGPERQRRVTVAFRVVLAIPHFLFAGVLGQVVQITVVIAWFAALFTGRVPEGLATFNGRVIQYTARVYAYGQYLMYGTFPSFGFDDADGSINVRYTPGRLNRAAVFFRLVLMIPAAIATGVVVVGVMVSMVVVWLVVLIAGRMPTSLFEALAAIMRYQIRFYAYAAMLTSEYPRGLFGDKTRPTTFDAADLPARPRITQLFLSRAAKGFVTLFMVLGLVFGIGLFAVIVVAAVNADRSYNELVDAENDLAPELRAFEASAQSCAVSGGIDCIHAADRRLADAFEAFRADLRSIEFAAVDQPLASDLDAVTGDVIDHLERLATTTDPGAFAEGARELGDLLDEFYATYNALAEELYYS